MELETNVKVETVEPGVFASTIADEIAASILDCIEDHGQCSIVLSGGSTPSAVYRLLSRPPYTQDIPWEKVHLFVGDDKWIFGDECRTNFRMISETLLSHRKSPDENVHSIDTTKETSEAAAEAYSKDIRDFFGLAEGEIPAFDIVLLGVGADGHIASVFADSSIIHDEKSIACVTEHDGIKSVTLTPHVLFNGQRILILVKGRDKAEIVNSILKNKPSAENLPAMLYKEAISRVTWFLCSEAAQQLNGTM